MAAEISALSLPLFVICVSVMSQPQKHAARYSILMQECFFKRLLRNLYKKKNRLPLVPIFDDVLVHADIYFDSHKIPYLPVWDSAQE